MSPGLGLHVRPGCSTVPHSASWPGRRPPRPPPCPPSGGCAGGRRSRAGLLPAVHGRICAALGWTAASRCRERGPPPGVAWLDVGVQLVRVRLRSVATLRSTPSAVGTSRTVKACRPAVPPSTAARSWVRTPGTAWLDGPHTGGLPARNGEAVGLVPMHPHRALAVGRRGKPVRRAPPWPSARAGPTGQIPARPDPRTRRLRPARNAWNSRSYCLGGSSRTACTWTDKSCWGPLPAVFALGNSPGPRRKRQSTDSRRSGWPPPFGLTSACRRLSKRTRYRRRMAVGTEVVGKMAIRIAWLPVAARGRRVMPNVCTGYLILSHRHSTLRLVPRCQLVISPFGNTLAMVN